MDFCFSFFPKEFSFILVKQSVNEGSEYLRIKQEQEDQWKQNEKMESERAKEDEMKRCE